MSPEQLMNFIRNGNFPDKQIKAYIENGDITRQQLIDNKIFTEKQLEDLFRISPEEYKRNLFDGKYSIAEAKALAAKNYIEQDDLQQFYKQNIINQKFSNKDIIELLTERQITEAVLVKEGILKQEEVDYILGRPLPLLKVDFESWDEIPELLPNRFDVFVLGSVGSGKSAFMAGLFWYSRKNGLLINKTDHATGHVYLNAITDAVERGVLPPRTPEEKMQYMLCDFKTPNNQYVPMTFVEMSGEVFQKCYGKKSEDMPKNFKKYITHENSKVIMLAVDYNEHLSTSYSDISQASKFSFILQVLDKEEALKNAKAICILITKWDKSIDQSAEAAKAFLQEKYAEVYMLCEMMKDKYKIKFEVYCFSLGQFTPRNSYVYDDKDSKLIFNWLCSFIPVKAEEKKPGFLRRLFN